MSNHAPPPPPPPPGAAPPPPSSAPAPSYSPNPAGAGSAKSGIPTWGKIGIGCGCLGLIVLVAGFMLLGWGAKKAAEAVSDPASLAEFAIKAHPDFELVETDKATGRITIREKATQEVRTFDYSDIANGNFSFEGPDGEKVEIGASAGGVKITDADGKESTMNIEQDASGDGVRITSSEGEFRMGGDIEIPSWVPQHPDVQFGGGMSSSGSGVQTGNVAAENVTPSLEDLEAWYKEQFEKSFNCNIDRSAFEMSGTKTVILSCKDGETNVAASMSQDGNKRTLGLTYSGPIQ